MPLIDPFATRLTRAELTRLNRQLEPQSATIADRARSTGFAAVLEPLAKTIDAVVAGESMLAADRVTPEAAKVVVSLLESLPVEPLPVARDALESRRADAPAAREAAAVLAVSVWSILAVGQVLDKAAVMRVQKRRLRRGHGLACTAARPAGPGSNSCCPTTRWAASTAALRCHCASGLAWTRSARRSAATAPPRRP